MYHFLQVDNWIAQLAQLFTPSFPITFAIAARMMQQRKFQRFVERGNVYEIDRCLHNLELVTNAKARLL